MLSSPSNIPSASPFFAALAPNLLKERVRNSLFIEGLRSWTASSTNFLLRVRVVELISLDFTVVYAAISSPFFAFFFVVLFSFDSSCEFSSTCFSFFDFLDDAFFDFWLTNEDMISAALSMASLRRLNRFSTSSLVDSISSADSTELPFSNSQVLNAASTSTATETSVEILKIAISSTLFVLSLISKIGLWDFTHSRYSSISEQAAMRRRSWVRAFFNSLLASLSLDSDAAAEQEAIRNDSGSLIRLNASLKSICPIGTVFLDFPLLACTALRCGNLDTMFSNRSGIDLSTLVSFPSSSSSSSI